MTLEDLYNTKDKGSYRSDMDLAEGMKDFSFCKFCNRAWLDTETGSAIVITGKQYIVSYTADLGRGPHAGVFARIMKEFQGGGKIGDDNKEVLRLVRELKDRYIVARIDYSGDEDYYHHKLGRGIMTFFFGNKSFSPNEYAVFEQFYEKYNEDIKSACELYKLSIDYEYENSDGDIVRLRTKDLDDIRDYIKNHIDVNKEDYPDEVIFDPKKNSLK